MSGCSMISPMGTQDDEQAEEEPGQLADAVADAGEVHAEEEDRRDLHELGGLDPQLSDAEPGPGAVHLPAEQQREDDQQEVGRRRSPGRTCAGVARPKKVRKSIKAMPETAQMNCLTQAPEFPPEAVSSPAE